MRVAVAVVFVALRFLEARFAVNDCYLIIFNFDFVFLRFLHSFPFVAILKFAASDFKCSRFNILGFHLVLLRTKIYVLSTECSLNFLFFT